MARTIRRKLGNKRRSRRMGNKRKTRHLKNLRHLRKKSRKNKRTKRMNKRGGVNETDFNYINIDYRPFEELLGFVVRGTKVSMYEKLLKLYKNIYLYWNTNKQDIFFLPAKLVDNDYEVMGAINGDTAKLLTTIKGQMEDHHDSSLKDKWRNETGYEERTRIQDDAIKMYNYLQNKPGIEAKERADTYNKHCRLTDISPLTIIQKKNLKDFESYQKEIQIGEYVTVVPPTSDKAVTFVPPTSDKAVVIGIFRYRINDCPKIDGGLFKGIYNSVKSYDIYKFNYTEDDNVVMEICKNTFDKKDVLYNGLVAGLTKLFENPENVILLNSNRSVIVAVDAITLEDDGIGVEFQIHDINNVTRIVEQPVEQPVKKTFLTRVKGWFRSRPK